MFVLLNLLIRSNISYHSLLFPMVMHPSFVHPLLFIRRALLFLSFCSLSATDRCPAHSSYVYCRRIPIYCFLHRELSFWYSLLSQYNHDHHSEGCAVLLFLSIHYYAMLHSVSNSFVTNWSLFRHSDPGCN